VPRALSTVALLVALLAPGLGHAELSLPGLGDEPEESTDQSPRRALQARYEALEQDYDDRLDRRRDEYRWRIERLDVRRLDAEGQLQGWRERLAELRRRGRGPARQDLLAELLVLAAELDGVLRELIDAHDAQLQHLQRTAAGARRLAVELEAHEVLREEPLGTVAIDAHLRQLDSRRRQRETRLAELRAARETLAGVLDAHRSALEEARRDLYASTALPTPGMPEVAPSALPDALAAPLEPVEVELGPAERELLALRGERDRLRAAIFERRCDLDAKRLELIDLETEQVELVEPQAAWVEEAWRERRASAAAREEDGIFNLSPSPFRPEGLLAGVEHTETLLADPAALVAAVESALVPEPGRRDPRRALLALLVVGLLLLELDRRLYLLVLAARPRSRGDELALLGVRVLLPVLPAVVICSALLLLELVPASLRPLLQFGVVAPPAVGVAVALAASLFPPTGSTTMTAAGTRRAMRLVQAGALATALVGLAGSVMPLLGYPGGARTLARALLLLLLLLGWESILIRRAELLELMGATGSTAEIPAFRHGETHRIQAFRDSETQRIGVLRASVRRSYRLLAVGPVVVFALYGIGYINLAGLLIRGGLVTIGVLLLAPWVHHRLRRATERVLGYPDGGGWFALSSAFATAAYRAVAPLLLLAVGLVSLSLLASGWNYGGDVLRNLGAAVTHPLWEVGQSRITGLSLLLFAVTLSLAILAQGWIVGLLERGVFPLYDLDQGMRATLSTLVRYLMLGLGVLIGLKVVGLSLRVLTVFAGVIGLAVGFGSQTLAANFMAGIMLLLGRRISVGDVIEVQGIVGRVVRISGYSTVVRTLDNLLVTVPNSKLLDDSVTNWTAHDTSVRLSLAVGVAYGSDTALVRRLLLQTATEDPRVLSRPRPMVRFDEFADSALLFTLCPWVQDPDQRFVITSDLRFRIDELFREHGVEIAFPQQDVHLAGGEARIRVELDRGGEEEP